MMIARMVKSLGGVALALALSGQAMAQSLPSPDVSTRTLSDSTTKAASTAFVQNQLAAGTAAFVPGTTPVSCTNMGAILYSGALSKGACSNLILVANVTVNSSGAAAANSTAINAQIQLAGTLGGATVVPSACGAIYTAATIDNNVPRVMFSGCGRDYIHDATATLGTVIKPTFAGTALKHRSPFGATNPRITGGGFINLAVDGNGHATRLLEVTSTVAGTYMATLFDSEGAEAAYFTSGNSGTDLGEAADTQQATIDLSIRNLDSANALNSACVTLDGTATANFSQNRKVNITCQHWDGDALHILNADNNDITILATRPGGSGKTIFCGGRKGSDNPSGCNGNNFVRVAGSGAIYAEGTADTDVTDPVKNVIGILDTGNGTPAPTAGTGSQWTYYSNIQNVTVNTLTSKAAFADSAANAVTCFARMTTETLRYCNSSAAGIFMDDNTSTNVWAMRLNGADLEFIVRAGGGSLNLPPAIKVNGVATLSATTPVRRSDDGGACNLVVSSGLITSTTCVSNNAMLCDGSTADNAALNAAIASASARGVAVLQLPPGNCHLSPSTQITLASNLHIKGSTGGTTLTVTGPLTQNLISGLSLTNVEISDMTIAGGDYTATGNYALIQITETDTGAVRNVTMTGIDRFGVALNSVANFAVEKNTISRSAAIDRQNQSILVSCTFYASTNVRIVDNKLINSAVDVCAAGSEIARNDISGWGFGAGVTTEVDATCQTNRITENVIHGGVGIDVNGTRALGIENWCPRTIISSNIVYGNSGDGINIGGSQNIVNANIVLNNGTSMPGSGVCGITVRYSGAPEYENGNYSIISNNRSYDSGPNIQHYGYCDQNSSVTGVVLTGNNFTPNATGPMRLLGTVVNEVRPRMTGSASWTPGAIAAGASVSKNITISGARMGGGVTPSFSLDLSGASISGYVQADNAVTVVISNATGGTITLGAGTAYATAEMPVGYVNY